MSSQNAAAASVLGPLRRASGPSGKCPSRYGKSSSATGRLTPAWRAQLAHLADDLVPGVRLALLGEDGRILHLGTVTGPLAGVTIEGAPFAARAVDFRGDLARGDLPVPAQLQNPRRVFPVRLARSDAGLAP